ncbi:cilia- and flagella-associated protein 57-like, partial [Tachysurus ichikawai]
VLKSEKEKQKRLKAITGRAAKELQDLESLELQLRSKRIKKNYEKKVQKLKDGQARALEDIMQVKLKEKELELGQVRNGPAHCPAHDHTYITV